MPPKTKEPNQPPMVSGSTLDGFHPTHPETIRMTPIIHQRQTRSNLPVPAIMDVVAPPTDIFTQQLQTQKHTRSTRAPLQRVPPPKFLVPAVSQRNNMKQARERNKLSAIIRAQIKFDRVNNLSKKKTPPSAIDVLHKRQFPSMFVKRRKRTFPNFHKDLHAFESTKVSVCLQQASLKHP